MADKNQLKIADHVDLADDDPFAELTRIMGFDPRQPARPAAQPQEAAAYEAAPVEQAVEEDDFSLDLEKELLGEFSIEDEAPTHDFAAEAEMYAVEAPAPEASAEALEPAADVPADIPEVDFDFAADFEAALATSGQDGAVAEGEFDLDLTDDDVRALDAEAPQPAAAAPFQVEDGDFDLSLTDDDVRALDAEAAQPAAPVEAAAGIDSDFDAAMADIDMDFGDAFASAPAAEFSADHAAAAATQDEPVEADDLHLFDEADFRLDDHVADEPVAPVAAEPEPQPAIDESAFSFDQEELRLDDAHPVDAYRSDEPAAAPAADDFSFDDIDLTAEDFSAVPEALEPEEAMEPETAQFYAVEDSTPEPVADEPVADEPVDAEPEAAAAPALPSQAEPPLFEFSVPRYEPRKLPTSPMDIAAEEFRQREAAQAPAAPEFNLEDELNALLGNIRSGQAGASAATSPEPAGWPAEQAKVEEPAAPEAYQASHAAYEPADFRPAEPVGFDAPEHPVDIDDNLNWDIDGSFAADAAPEPVEDDQPQAYEQDAYAQDGQYDAYAEAAQPEDAYAEAAQPEDVYDQAFEDDLASLDVDDLSFDPATEAQPSTHYGAAAAGAGLGAAAAHFGSAFASRPYETDAPMRLSDLPRAPAGQHFAGQAQAAASSGPEPFSTHRDPVVRGNPLKEDPLDVIAALAEKYSRKEPVTPYGHAMGVARGSAPFAGQSDDDQDLDIALAFEEQPDVETIEVADKAVALADDLDIPEFIEEEELPTVSAYDDLDAEFSSLLSEMNAEPRAAAPLSSGQNGTYASFEAQPYVSQMAAMATSAVGPRQAPAPQSVHAGHPEQAAFALDEDDLPGSRPLDQYAPDDYEYDPDLDQEIAQHLAADDARQPKSRGMLVAALVGGVALLGAIGAFAFSFGGGSDGDTPALVRAEDGPVKVKPENPGGTTVPNQDSKVYETVAGEGTAGTPQQETLVTTAEEPVDVTPPPPAMEEDVAATASGKSEDRIEQILQETEGQTDDQIVAVAPRKVRTMVVKPDGTLVQREDEPAAAPSNEQTDTIATLPEAAAPAIPESTGALQAATQAPQDAAVAEPLAAQDGAAVETASGDRSAMPDTAPIAPLRPADQPIDVVGEVKPDQVAAATTAAANGNWAMQIASQPSEAAAQSSYQDLARRYGNVLQGREVNIVKAEIAGKGTFWRVRVPAATRNEAISLCENYKAAGGNCFVSR